MIIYNPLDGHALTSSIPSKPRHCFLMTRLGSPIPEEVKKMGESITKLCKAQKYKVINAGTEVTSRDFLLKIWKLIAGCPISIGVCHEEIPPLTQTNIYYEIGAAQAMGKETIIIKSVKAQIPSDFVRTEYIEYDNNFAKKFTKYLKSLDEIANYYEAVADQAERNPILAIDYIKRAFLMTGKEHLQAILKDAGLQERAKNSVEILAASF